MEPDRRVHRWVMGLALVGVVSIVVFGVGAYRNRHRGRSLDTLVFLVRIQFACQQYKVIHKVFPPTDPDGGTRELLRVLSPQMPPILEKPTETNGGQCVDEWGRPLRYRINAGGQAELRSAGPDGLFDTDDDVAFSA